MSSVPRSALARQFRMIFEVGTVAGLTDSQLLERFLERRDEAGEVAFDALVTRHGPMVLGVCRRALPDPNDAADAFQATFLILVRKARSIRVDDSLGRWLYGVSRRVAARARVEAARRPRSIPANLEAPAIDPDRFERASIVDEELARLPEAFRSALILCDLEGLTHEEAARDLVCPVGTIKSRLARGRQKLRKRLERRGLVPSMAILTAPAVPHRLAEAVTFTAQLTLNPGSATAGMLPASAVALAQGVLKSMSGFPLKIVATAALTLGLAATGVGVLAQPQKGEGTPAVVAAKTVPPVPAKVTESGADALSEKEEDQKSVNSTPAPAAEPSPITEVVSEITQIEQARLKLAKAMQKLRDAKRIARSPGDAAITHHTQEIVNQQLELATIELKKILAEVVEAEKLSGETRIGERVRVEALYNTPFDFMKLVVPDYVVEPSDIISVEVAEALAGRPISGERRVKPDGKITLGIYGEVYVAGLTAEEIKEKIVEHLRNFLDDKTLGLTRNNPMTLKLERLKPSETKRVFVDVVSVNSKVYYVQGHVGKPSKFPCTGNETVLDAINFAGGLTEPGCSVRLVRINPADHETEVSLPVDYEAIVKKGETTTNYRIMPGDRVVVSDAPTQDRASRKISPVDPADPRVRLGTLGRGLEELLDEIERPSKP